MMQHPDLIKKGKEEYRRVIVDPFLKANPGKPFDVIEATTYDNIQDLKFLSQCFSETLRIEPPLLYSTSHQMIQDTPIGKYMFKKGTIIIVDIKGVHWDESEWKEPENFIPDRFDPSSEYYLNSSGQKRHPMSYCPYFGG